MRRFAIVSLTGLALAACGGANAGISSTADAHETPLVGPCEPGDPLELLSYRQEERRLYVQVRHGGGCERHTYVACMEDPHPLAPPVYTLRIHHDDRGDMCEAELTQVLRVDLDREIQATSMSDGVILLE